MLLKNLKDVGIESSCCASTRRYSVAVLTSCRCDCIRMATIHRVPPEGYLLMFYLSVEIGGLLYQGISDESPLEWADLSALLLTSECS